MKKTLFAAFGLLAIGGAAVSAQEWRRDRYPYEAREHGFCQERGREVSRLTRDVEAGRSTHRERETLIALKTDLDRRCGGWRFR